VTEGRVTPPLGARAPALTASTLPPLSVWPFGPPWRVGKHKRAQITIGPSQSPSRSLETARPVGRASALVLCPGAKVSGSQTDLLTPWYDGWAEIIPFRYLPVLLGGKGTSHVGWDTGDLPGKKLRASNPTRPMCSPRRDDLRRASVPPHPLRVAREGGRGERE
jgi:hypothetical protein